MNIICTYLLDYLLDNTYETKASSFIRPSPTSHNWIVDRLWASALYYVIKLVGMRRLEFNPHRKRICTEMKGNSVQYYR